MHARDIASDGDVRCEFVELAGDVSGPPLRETSKKPSGVGTIGFGMKQEETEYEFD
jgi:hypothetical protein